MVGSERGRKPVLNQPGRSPKNNDLTDEGHFGKKRLLILHEETLLSRLPLSRKKKKGLLRLLGRDGEKGSSLGRKRDTRHEPCP